jgi:hypothetical protein
MTSVCQATPKRLDCVLDTAEDCAALRRHMLDEDELASWPQNAPDLSEGLALVFYGAQNGSRDHCICGLIGQI